MALAGRLDDRAQELPAAAAGLRLWTLRLEPRPGDRCAPLDAADRARLATMRPGDADRLLARRAIARAVVSELTGCAPDAVRLSGADGPRSVAVGDTTLAYASTSSSGYRGLLALADTPVGADVEQCPGPPDALEVSAALLAPSEHAWIAGGTAARSRFLRVWVRKEAVVKCTGEGLSRDLRSFVVDARTASAPVTAPEGRLLGIRTYGVDLPDAVGAVALAEAPALRSA